MPMTQPRSRYITILLGILIGLTIAALVLFYGGGEGREPVYIGFSGQLTGYQAELGVQERNGAWLAVEDINAAGGINGRPLVLLVRDDLGTPEGARNADAELIAEGVVAIIGHPTSSQTLEGLPVTEPAGILMISPTTSTQDLSGMDDLFFRLVPVSSERASAFARHIQKRQNLTQLAVITDIDNAAYTVLYGEALNETFSTLGGTITSAIEFSSKTKPDFAPQVSELKKSGAQGLFIIANDYDTALIAQRVRLCGWDVPMYASGWAQTETLLASGGSAVEGMEIEQALFMESTAPAFLDFKERYEDRFGRPPSFGAVLSYESVGVLAQALRSTGKTTEHVKEALLAVTDFPGLTDTFSFTRFGDVIRPYYISTIRNGTYADFEAILPEQ